MGKLANKVVFITGSSKGIGKASALAFLSKGARVVINGRNKEQLEKTKAELLSYGGEVIAINADVSESEAFESALKEINTVFGRIDIIILNAGLSSYGSVASTSDEAMNKVLNVNLMGPARATRIALPHLLESKGSIVYISSLAGLHGIPNSSLYSMSKMALTALAQSLKTEVNGSGLHVGIVYVGFTVNDPEKTIVAPDGKIRPIQERPGWIQQSPEKVAKLIMHSVKHRRFRTVLSLPGKFMAFSSRYFPRLFQLSMKAVLKSSEKLTAE